MSYFNPYNNQGTWADCPGCGCYDKMIGGLCRSCGIAEDDAVEAAQINQQNRYEAQLNRRLDGPDEEDESMSGKLED